MADKIIITKDGIQEVNFTAEEQAQREAEQQAQAEQAQLDLLIPTDEEVAQAEFELKTITLLQEVGLI
jgi:hypothetical protein